MELTLQLPDAEASELSAKLGDLNRAALEALVARGYREGVLNLAQVGLLMNLDNRWEAEKMLAELGAWPGQSVEEVLEDAKTVSKFMARRESRCG